MKSNNKHTTCVPELHDAFDLSPRFLCSLLEHHKADIQTDKQFSNPVILQENWSTWRKQSSKYIHRKCLRM